MVELSADSVRVSGTSIFDAAYAIVSRADKGVGFMQRHNKAVQGFLHRYSGQLDLHETGKTGEAPRPGSRRWLHATCARAQPLF